jgi:ubiquinone/menaquinone biosynthesis C-methylase UbiE
MKISKTNYSKIAEYYDKVRHVRADVWIPKIIQYGKIENGSLVLDVGCGTGSLAISLSTSQNAHVFSIDDSSKMLKKALTKDKNRKVHWVLSDAHKLPFKNNCFGCMYMALVIHHLENKELALQEIYRVLRKGGSCVIMTHSHYRIKRHFLRYFPGITAIDLKRFSSILFLKTLMEKIGFRNVHSHLAQQDEGYIRADEILEKVKSKYISTLTLLSEEQFQKGFHVFQEKIKRKYGERKRQIYRYNFVVGLR